MIMEWSQENEVTEASSINSENEHMSTWPVSMIEFTRLLLMCKTKADKL